VKPKKIPKAKRTLSRKDREFSRELYRGLEEAKSGKKILHWVKLAREKGEEASPEYKKRARESQKRVDTAISLAENPELDEEVVRRKVQYMFGTLARGRYDVPRNFKKANRRKAEDRARRKSHQAERLSFATRKQKRGLN